MTDPAFSPGWLDRQVKASVTTLDGLPVALRESMGVRTASSEPCPRRCDPHNPTAWCWRHEPPYTVACPRCGAQPQNGCFGPAGWDRPPHKARVKAAQG